MVLNCSAAAEAPSLSVARHQSPITNHQSVLTNHGALNGNYVARHSLRRPHADEKSRLHDCRGHHFGAGHRREYCDLQHGGCFSAAAAPGCRASANYRAAFSAETWKVPDAILN